MIKFRRTKPRLWRGNGMGYDPAEYAIIRNGAQIGRISASITYGWDAKLNDGGRLYGETLAAVKNQVLGVVED